MTPTFAGISYLTAFFALGLLAFRFYQYWGKEKTIVAKIFFYMAADFALQMLICAVAGLFFTSNAIFLRWTVILTVSLQSFIFAIVGHMIGYIKFQKASPWLFSLPLLILGIFAVILTVITPFSPTLDKTGGINWDIQPAPNILRTFLFLITLIPLILVLLGQFKNAQNSIAKAKALGLIGIFTFVILTGFLDFFFVSVLGLGAIYSNMALGVVSILIFVIIFLTQRPPLENQNQNA